MKYLLACLLALAVSSCTLFDSNESRSKIHDLELQLNMAHAKGFVTGQSAQEKADKKQNELDATVSSIHWLYYTGIALIALGCICFFWLPAFKRTSIAEVVGGFCMIFAARTLIIILPYAHWIGIGALVCYGAWRLWLHKTTHQALGAAVHGVEDFAGREVRKLIDHAKSLRPTAFFKKAK